MPGSMMGSVHADVSRSLALGWIYKGFLKIYLFSQ